MGLLAGLVALVAVVVACADTAMSPPEYYRKPQRRTNGPVGVALRHKTSVLLPAARASCWRLLDGFLGLALIGILFLDRVVRRI